MAPEYNPQDDLQPTTEEWEAYEKLREMDSPYVRELRQRAEKAERLVEAYRAEAIGRFSVKAEGSPTNPDWFWQIKNRASGDTYDTREAAMLAALTELEKK